jgi:hypothetical protein
VIHKLLNACERRAAPLEERGSVNHVGSECRTAKSQLLQGNTQMRPEWKARCHRRQTVNGCPLEEMLGGNRR